MWNWSPNGFSPTTAIQLLKNNRAKLGPKFTEIYSTFYLFYFFLFLVFFPLFFLVTIYIYMDIYIFISIDLYKANISLLWWCMDSLWYLKHFGFFLFFKHLHWWNNSGIKKLNTEQIKITKKCFYFQPSEIILKILVIHIPENFHLCYAHFFP